jgi:hypothetical protein
MVLKHESRRIACISTSFRMTCDDFRSSKQFFEMLDVIRVGSCSYMIFCSVLFVVGFFLLI